MPLPAIDLTALLEDEEENLKLEQINVMHISIIDLLDNPGNPLYAKPHSIAEHFNTILVGAHALGDLPGWTRCRDSDVTTRVYDDKVKQVCQKILRCLDMRVMDGDLIVPTCLQTPTLILPARHFTQMYYNSDAQGQYASQFPTGGQGFLQPRGDIRTSIMPRNFQVLPTNVREVVDQYFHREELERRANLDEDEYMSINTEAAQTVQRLQLHCPTAMVLLQVAVHKALVLATATRPQEQEYYYDSDDLVLDLDEEYPDLAEQVVQWQATRRGAASTPPWRPLDFGQHEWSYFDKLPNLRDLLNQAREARAASHSPVQSVAPRQLPFASVRDLDHQHQQCHDQTLAKRQSSPLDGEQRKLARTPPQRDLHDAPNKGCTRAQECEGRDCGHLKTRGEHRQQELDRVRSKSRARIKSRKQSKSRK